MNRNMIAAAVLAMCALRSATAQGTYCSTSPTNGICPGSATSMYAETQGPGAFCAPVCGTVNMGEGGPQFGPVRPLRS
jgi:hypothetical protein